MTDYPAYVRANGTVQDTDECTSGTHTCDNGQTCSNNIGSFTCVCSIGYSTVAKTNKSHDLKCVDTDECANKSACPKNSSCQNSKGSYSCSCNSGFIGHGCSDIDECLAENECHENATCTNTFGSYNCYCLDDYYGNGTVCIEGNCTDHIDCSMNEECVSPKAFDCTCSKGFERESSLSTGSCQDSNECLSENDCSENAVCLNSVGSYTCECTSGYYGDGFNCLPGNCSDESCPENESCVQPNSNLCQCKSGFHRNETCIDTDECLVSNDCDLNALCQNIIGSYKCTCREGYYGNGTLCLEGNCTDTVDCNVNEECISSDSFDCKCKYGFERKANGVCESFEGVLVLVSSKTTVWKPAVYIKSNGDLETISCFQPEKETVIKYSCSLIWQRKVYVYGGTLRMNMLYNQISRLDGLKLNRVGSLDFNMLDGGCSVMDEKHIFLCFDSYNSKDDNAYRQCWRSKNPLTDFVKIPASSFEHSKAKIITSEGYCNTVFAI